jgi:hypothetical protein
MESNLNAKSGHLSYNTDFALTPSIYLESDIYIEGRALKIPNQALRDIKT